MSAELAGPAVRVLPVLAFLVAITVVAEIADLAGGFDVAAHWAARVGRQRVWALWLLVVALACVSTIVLSLDTMAVLLIGVNVGPLITVWASLATLLWRQWCRAAEVTVSTAYLAREGLLCAVVATAASLGALVLVR